MKAWFKKYEAKIIILIGFILVSAISFEVGIIKSKNINQQPIIIEKAAETPKIALPEANPAIPDSATPEAEKTPESQNLPASETPKNCIFVGSKNSNKYHLPTCHWAKQIKEENKVCFSSAEEAAAKGYQPDKNCIK